MRKSLSLGFKLDHFTVKQKCTESPFEMGAIRLIAAHTATLWLD